MRERLVVSFEGTNKPTDPRLLPQQKGRRREKPKSSRKGASKQMVDSMTEKQLEEFAHTKRKGKPEHVGK
jgi:Protein of unknwon function (DUF3008)